MENPTYDPNSVSNILICLTLPDFLTEMTLITFTLNMLNGITLLNPIQAGVFWNHIDWNHIVPPSVSPLFVVQLQPNLA